jgi:hypothetical protein
VDPNVFETANAGFAQAIYEEYLRDPGAVEPEWRKLFESGVVGLNGADGQRGSEPAGLTTEPPLVSPSGVAAGRRDAHQGPGRPPRRPYGRERERADGDDVPDAPGR